MKNLLMLLLSLSLVSVSAKAEEVFYCTSELATGYVFKNGSWQTSDFELERWTLKFNADDTQVEGLASNPMNCTAPYSVLDLSHLLFCVNDQHSHQVLIFNKKTKDFEFSGISGFSYAGTDQDTAEEYGIDTSALYAGSCEAF